MDLHSASQLRGACEVLCPTPLSSMESIANQGNQSHDILSSTTSNHPGPSSLLLSSMVTVSSPSTTAVSTQPPLKGLINFTSSSSIFVPHQWLSKTRSEQKKKTGGSTHNETSIDSDPTGEYPSESSSMSFLNKSIGSPMSIRVPDTEVQPHSTYSGDEESSDDEELPKQTWRAERFYMEEFLREMQVV